MMSYMPWDRVELRGWSIVGMNHYHVGGIRRLFVAMTKDGRCIKAEGVYEPNVWRDLAALAYAVDPSSKLKLCAWFEGDVDCCLCGAVVVRGATSRPALCKVEHGKDEVRAPQDQ